MAQLSLEDIRQDADGIFYVRKYLGTNAITGKPLRPYKRFPKAATPEEALALALAWYQTIKEAHDLRVSQRLDQLLCRYIDHMPADTPPNTIKTYRSTASRYIDPYLGAADPAALRPYHFEGLYNTLALKGARRGGGVAQRTIAKAHWFARGAFKWFNTQGICANNPLLAVKLHKLDVERAISLTETQHNRIQKAIYDVLRSPAEGREAILMRNVAFGAHLMLNTGERAGEACANWRGDVDLSRMFIHVGATAVEEKGRRCYRGDRTKSGRFRNVSIDAGLCRDIEEHYAWQDTYLPRGRRGGARTFLVTDADGDIVRPSRFDVAFKELARATGLPPRVTPHTLRHTHATWLLIDGTDWREIQERLGHSDATTTIRLYAHVMPGRDRAAADAFAKRRERMGGAL